jgi:hypothetical protein
MRAIGAGRRSPKTRGRGGVGAKTPSDQDLRKGLKEKLEELRVSF